MRIFPVLFLLCLILWPSITWAYSVSISSGTRTLYLRVGDGAFSGTLNNGGSPRNLTTVNVVSITVPANQIGNGLDLSMTTNATGATSFWDGYNFCNVPGQLYIGGFYRHTNNSSSAPQAILSASWPVNLTNANGESIPFSDIRWTSSGNGDTGTQIIPSGSFNSSPKTLSSWTRNTWNESCHSFIYANDKFVGSGVYTGRVTYTLSLP